MSYKKVLLCLAFSSLLLRGSGQYNNNVLGSVGFIPSLTAYYERELNKPLVKKPTFFVRAGFSYFGIWGAAESVYGHFGLLTNTSKHKFEMALGGGIILCDGCSQPEGIVSGNLGYRFQKSNSRFLFRTGLGFPEFLYVGTGFSF